MKIFPGKHSNENRIKLPTDLVKKIKGLSSDGIKRAIFDMDNTILNGDIGDALFCRIVNLEQLERVRMDGELIDLSWEEYEDLISSGKRETAYRRVVECMNKIPVQLVKNLTRELMNSDFRFLEHSGDKIVIPNVNPGMASLLMLLKNEDYEIKVISASNSVSAKIIAEEYLGLGADNTYGIETEIINNDDGKMLFSANLKEPVPVNHGKAELYHKEFGNELPLIVAGDTEFDFPMLDLVSDGGIVLWRGDEGALLDRLKNSIGDRADVFSLRSMGFGNEDKE